MWDLLLTKWHCGRFSTSNSVSPANFHSTKWSTVIIIIHHLGPTYQVDSVSQNPGRPEMSCVPLLGFTVLQKRPRNWPHSFVGSLDAVGYETRQCLAQEPNHDCAQYTKSEGGPPLRQTCPLQKHPVAEWCVFMRPEP
jgi:hypothetical protein